MRLGLVIALYIQSKALIWKELGNELSTPLLSVN
jgi:hypothetical protein